MPSSDYTASTSGALKFKGSSGVTKSNKKKKKKRKEEAAKTTSTPPPVDDEASYGQAEAEGIGKPDEASEKPQEDEEESIPQQQLSSSSASLSVVDTTGKTAAELAFEQNRRKRMDERLRREGVKTHKQRVEELNRYLSGLSEHHDMPRIGPG